MNNILKKEKCRLVVTDSGLGGLEIAADLYERLKKGKYFRKAEIIYFNCRPSNTLGYNDMQTDKNRCHTFSNALLAAEEYFSPDLIFIACNTLSVLYNNTVFSRKTKTPERGIVNDGVRLIEDFFNMKKDSEVIMLGTGITVKSAMHKKILAAKGFPEEKMIYHACTELVDAIESGALSENTQRLIDKYLTEAVSKTRRHNNIALALLCTHFGYSRELFLRGAENAGINLECILNPNNHMVDHFISNISQSGFEDSTVQIKVVTQAAHMPAVKSSISSIISRRSPDTADALQNDTFIFNLFKI